MAQMVRFGRLKTSEPKRIAAGPWAARAAPAKPRSSHGWLRGLGLVSFAFVVSAVGFAWLFGALDLEPAARPTAAAGSTPTAGTSFALCSNGSQTDCVVDGDTFRYHGAIIRIADIDTPETRDAKCASERALGNAAKHRLHALLNAGPFAIEPYERDTDRYGRQLRIITRDGHSLGMLLVGEGLARAWDGARHPWC